MVDLRRGLRIPPAADRLRRLRGHLAAGDRRQHHRGRLRHRGQRPPSAAPERRGARLRRRHRQAEVELGPDAAGPEGPRRRDLEERQRARTGAANAWSVIVADPERNLVFVPTGSPSPDYYGGERPGDNLYANSVVALRADPGERVWPFQTVHHDLWDYDVASPPVLFDGQRQGRTIPARRRSAPRPATSSSWIAPPARPDLRRRGAAGAEERRRGRSRGSPRSPSPCCPGRWRRRR